MESEIILSHNGTRCDDRILVIDDQLLLTYCTNHILNRT